jgi:hypothetical protein
MPSGAASSRVRVVWPVPGGPHRIIVPRLPAAMISMAPAKYVIKNRFRSASTVIARAGTWRELSTPSCLIVIFSSESRSTKNAASRRASGSAAAAAGVVVVHTFLPEFFNKCGLIDNKEFIDNTARERAVQLLLYLASGETETPENDLLLPKFLCGVPFEQPINGEIILSELEKAESIHLLEAVIAHWSKLKKTSPDGLREGFLQRDGKLEKRPQGWYLNVEQKSIDILLDFLPWNLRIIKLPWMGEILRVEWE